MVIISLDHKYAREVVSIHRSYVRN